MRDDETVLGNPIFPIHDHLLLVRIEKTFILLEPTIVVAWNPWQPTMSRL